MYERKHRGLAAELVRTWHVPVTRIEVAMPTAFWPPKDAQRRRQLRTDE
jgi:hypothetical protein